MSTHTRTNGTNRTTGTSGTDDTDKTAPPGPPFGTGSAPAGIRHGWVLALMSAAAFMAVLDVLVVTTALTTIQRSIHATPEQLGWTVNAYTLTLAVSILPAAALGDRYGRVRVLVVGLTLFSLCSAACALAPSIGPLIAARALQGVGAATVMPLTLSIIGASFPPERRGRAIGVWGGLTGLAVAAGPLIGGAVVQGLGWQWIFWINVVLGAVLMPLILRHAPESRGERVRLDLPGMALAGMGAFGLVWGMVRGNDVGWGSAEILGSLLGGAALLAAFVLWELRSRTPMLPMPFFRDRAFSAGHAAGFLMTASLLGAVFLMAQYFQLVTGASPLGAGARLLPWTATPMLVAPLAGVLADRFGERWILTGGLALQALGLAVVALQASTSSSYGALAGGLVAAGVGISLALPTVQTAILGAVPPQAIGKASGSSNTFRQLGGAFGVALALAVFTHWGGLSTPDRFTAGFRPAVAVLAGLSLLGALCGALLPARRAANDGAAQDQTARDRTAQD